MQLIMRNADVQEKLAMMAFNQKIYRAEPNMENGIACYEAILDLYSAVDKRKEAIKLTPTK